LSAVRRQVRTFLSGTLEADNTPTSSGEDEEAADAVDRAILVIDELASNALRHGAAPASLHLCDEPDRWIVIVSDGAPHRSPTPAIGRPEGQGGYGLYVIADLTGAHGVHYEADLKRVWACIDKSHPDPSHP
jgi:two-component sensor histidine kinase